MSLTRNIKYSLPVAAAFYLSVLTGCTKNFASMNTNPNGLTDSMLQLDHAGLGAFFPVIEKNVIPVAANTGDGSVYQVAVNLNADLFSGYMGTPTAFGGGQNNSTYALNSGWDNAPFNVGYNTVMPNWYQIRLRAAASNPDFYAVANILKVAAMHRITDVYGPLPYTGYGGGGYSVPYNGQDVIYNAFFSELDSAITTLSAYVAANPGATPLANYDLVFGGKYVEWIKFANSLKLRLAMRIVYANPTLAQQEAEAAVNNTYGVMTANTDNAFVGSANGITIYNPVWVIDYNYGDIRAGAVLGSFLNGYGDPRLPAIMTASTTYPGQYIGIRSGISILTSADRTAREGFSSMNLNQNSPIQWMTAAEVDFLRAEGALRGWNMGGTAQSFYEGGIQLSFSYYGVGSAASYITNTTSTAAPYTDPVDATNNEAAGSPDLSTITIAWNSGDTFEHNLERIITQKWLAVFPNGEEAWAEFRRTGYPKVWPVLINYSQGTISTQIQIRRLPFPQVEYQNDNAAVTAAVSLLSGPDNGGTKLWWDKK
ncbi:RagB/SusD family nutrient uptake outer membrane protein [Dinghuibacter silviterrae]|uniref:SusD/RagB-like outer membrane lipoprotein n=1 Tax=Dinghuibacter silviterrae TaxID=1539049 RepID=A0A4R8DT14_9BACT|nr:RagB/SusD family nutrient uptake outer membrane protein [Dinghuibacter silviterrae]TDX00291.1 SusD/RagB-like outer membrane lipoprotein [Dinghuibacter silviterrae]